VAQDNREPTPPRSHAPGRIQGIDSEEMKGRREFQLLIADIRDTLADVTENRCGDLFHATWASVRFEDELARDSRYGR
jgi:hypothetical protein